MLTSADVRQIKVYCQRLYEDNVGKIKQSVLNGERWELGKATQGGAIPETWSVPTLNGSIKNNQDVSGRTMTTK